MSDTKDDGNWEDWGDAPDASTTTKSALSPRTSPPPSSNIMSASTVPPPPRELLAWDWDLDAIDAELATLVPSSASVLPSLETPSDDRLATLAKLALPTRTRLGELRVHTESMQAMAAVAQWKLRQLEQSLTASDTHADESTLAALAGDWGCTDHGASNETLDETARLLHHALEACGQHDMTPFTQALEQLFATLPDQQLVVPTTWLYPATEKSHDSTPVDDLVTRLVALSTNEDDERSTVRLRTLAAAQVFQDTKDVERDEVVVNGEHVVGGAIGYDAVVATIERHLMHAIEPLGLPRESESLVRVAAQHILSVCNRTESGGSAFEILSQLLTNHTTDRVLLRPASAKAPPLTITTDVGVFFSHEADWCFGLRVRIAASTVYCLCDADDPTHELDEIETAFSNRLAFPLGLTPLAPRDLWRRDAGDVTISVRQDVLPEQKEEKEEDLEMLL